MRYKDIKRIIDGWDPMDLQCCGCPVDEYDIDTKRIWAAVLCNGDLGAGYLDFFIYNQLCENYGSECQTMLACRVIAGKIEGLRGDKTIQHYFCPMLNQEISEDACSDENMKAIMFLSRASMG